MKHRLYLLVLVTLICVTSIAADQTPGSQLLPRLTQWMSGSFSSLEQSQSDTSFMDIRVQMLPIWPQLSSGIYVYVEQARSDQLNLPYRQRVYRLAQIDDSTLTADILEFKVRARVIGAWRKNTDGKPNPAFTTLENLTPADLMPKEGCTLFLHAQGDSAFVGTTHERDCTNRLRGAVYATTEFKLTADYLYMWDRGFDSLGVQTWGTTSGGYQFKRVRE